MAPLLTFFDRKRSDGSPSPSEAQVRFDRTIAVEDTYTPTQTEVQNKKAEITALERTIHQLTESTTASAALHSALTDKVQGLIKRKAELNEALRLIPQKRDLIGEKSRMEEQVQYLNAEYEVALAQCRLLVLARPRDEMAFCEIDQRCEEIKDAIAAKKVDVLAQHDAINRSQIQMDEHDMLVAENERALRAAQDAVADAMKAHADLEYELETRTIACEILKQRYTER